MEPMELGEDGEQAVPVAVEVRHAERQLGLVLAPVEDGGLVAQLLQTGNYGRPDEPGAADDQDAHLLCRIILARDNPS
jgi:hypothetical protein